jgi:hypothetical protein
MAVYTTRITFNRDWDEYTVKLYKKCQYVVDADYFTYDREDAIATAKEMGVLAEHNLPKLEVSR